MANNLMDYLPDYYDGVYEMEAIMHAQGGVLDEMDDRQMRTLLNEFVIKTDIRGISVFEDQIGVIPEPGDSLEDRQNRVLMRLLPPHPITLRYLRELFKTLKIPAEVSVFRPKREAIVEANKGEITNKQIDNVKYILNVYLPANMIYQIQIKLPDAKISDQLKIGIGILAGAHLIAPVNSDYIDQITNTKSGISNEANCGIGQWYKGDALVLANTAQFESKGK
ncbi:MAG: YmfQ family protein [Lactobacillus sp.]|nr:YmfQ family protein [Lactobacillus sp.]